MVTWRNRIKSLPWRKVMSEKTLAKLTKIMSILIKFAKKTYAKIQKNRIYKKLELKLSKVSKRNKSVAGVILVIVIMFGVYSILSAPRPPKIAVNQKTATVQKLVKGTPDYATVLPQGKTIASLGGWTRISPPKTSPVYTYIDKVENVQINVSEQPLPDNFKSDTAKQLEQLAVSEKATQKITVGGNTIFIGTSSQGPQSIFFIKNNLLILIKSDSTISENSWIQYINSLQ
jgi:hypothetical protein